MQRGGTVRTRRDLTAAAPAMGELQAGPHDDGCRPDPYDSTRGSCTGPHRHQAAGPLAKDRYARVRSGARRFRIGLCRQR